MRLVLKGPSSVAEIAVTKYVSSTIASGMKARLVQITTAGELQERADTRKRPPRGKLAGQQRSVRDVTYTSKSMEGATI
jgi:hypothetical protein